MQTSLRRTKHLTFSKENWNCFLESLFSMEESNELTLVGPACDTGVSDDDDVLVFTY